MTVIPIAGVVLAAGRSVRMGEINKLTEEWNGEALVSRVVRAAQSSKLDMFAVVTGHEAESVRAVLPPDCAFTQNDDFAGGMAGSIRAGIYRLQGLAAVMILLGDMPLVSAQHINAMIDAYKTADDSGAIVVATCDGKWGNPVLFGPDHFRALKMLDGDRGARDIIKENSAKVATVEIGVAAVRDFDTPDAFTR